MFINASAEFTSPSDPSHAFSAEHKRLMHEYIKGLAAKAGARDPDELSWQLNVLLEGATVKAHVEGDTSAGMSAKEMARVFIEQQLTSTMSGAV